jgi:hypothetical protein
LASRSGAGPGRAPKKLAMHVEVANRTSRAPQLFHLAEPCSCRLLKDVRAGATAAQNALHHRLQPARARAQAMNLFHTGAVAAAIQNQIELLRQFAQMEFTAERGATPAADILIV